MDKKNYRIVIDIQKATKTQEKVNKDILGELIAEKNLDKEEIKDLDDIIEELSQEPKIIQKSEFRNGKSIRI